MGSPVSIRHAKPDNLIQLWLGTNASRHPETEALTNITADSPTTGSGVGLHHGPGVRSPGR